jgi:ribosomal protein S18 acetylase RimI-like enzyme
MPTTYKPLTSTDIDAIVVMMQDFYAIDGYPMAVDASKKLFAEFLMDGNLGKAWLISSGETIAGYVILTFVFSFEYGGRIAFLDELYIKDEMRGKGIGKQTIAFVQEEARKAHVKTVYLEIEPHNEKAQQLYQASGFKIHKRKLMQYKTNNQ